MAMLGTARCQWPGNGDRACVRRRFRRPGPGEGWPKWTDAVQRDYAATRYSGLGADHPRRMPAHCIPVGPFSNGRCSEDTEGQPLVVGEAMYVVHAVAQCAVRIRISPGRDIRLRWKYRGGP